MAVYKQQSLERCNGYFRCQKKVDLYDQLYEYQNIRCQKTSLGSVNWRWLNQAQN